MTYEIKYRSEEEMKDSGIEWLRKIPKEWTKSKIKNHFKYEKGRKAQKLTKEYISINSGNYPVYSGQTENEGIMGRINTYEYDLDASLFVTTVGAKVMTPMILKGKFSLSQNCLIMIKTNQIIEKFVFYWLYPLFRFEKAMIPSYMQPSLRMEDLNKYNIYIPKFIEQQKIANFLDLKTAEFDSIISKKELLIEKLEEAKKSLISEVVTGKIKIVGGELVERKMDEMKDSGVEWLGMIPKDWEVTRLKYISYLNMGQSPDSKSVNQEKIGLPFLQGKAEFGIKHPKAINYCIDPKKKSAKGEILISVRAPVGELNFSDQEYCIGRGLASIRSKENIDYIFYFLSAHKNILRSYSTGSTFEAVSLGQIENLNIIKLDIKTQNEISNFLNIKIEQIDLIATKTKLQIKKLKQAKQALISEAVTGKIDLRDWEIKEI